MRLFIGYFWGVEFGPIGQLSNILSGNLRKGVLYYNECGFMGTGTDYGGCVGQVVHCTI